MLLLLSCISVLAVAVEPGLFHRLLFRTLPTAKRPTTHPEFMYSTLSAQNLRQPEADELFDYIVVGGGGAGCPFARTMADAGYKVLILERGGLREDHPVTWDLHGSGATLMDAAVSQAIVTTDGYISHIGHVLGGGTAVNLGFYIEGNDPAFRNQFKHNDLWEEATLWVRNRTANPSKHKEGYHHQLADFAAILSGNVTHGHRFEYALGANWKGSTIFDAEDDFRYASDTLLGPVSEFPPTLTLSIESNVEKVLFTRDEQTRVLKAQCVHYRESDVRPTALLGRRESAVGVLQNEATLHSWLRWYPNVIRFLGSLFGRIETKPLKQVCLNADARSEIVMSAGAILTPGLLYQSGIGPLEETSKLGLLNLLNAHHLGSFLGDRVFMPIAFFLREHILSRFDPAIVQRIALWKPEPGFRQTLQQTSEREVEQGTRSAWNMTTVRTRMSALDEILSHHPLSKAESLAPSNLQDIKSQSWAEAAQYRNISVEAVNEEGRVLPFPAPQSLQQAFVDEPILSGFEEISGGMMSTGCGVSTRYFFPPSLRSSIAVDIALETLYGCASLGGSSRSGVLSLCPLVQPILECFRKTAALVYMMPEPKSLGRLNIGGSDGKTLMVTGNYLKSETDIRAGTLGLAALLQALDSSKVFDDTFEFTTSSGGQCPTIMRDTLSSLLYRVMTLLTPYVGREEIERATESIDSAPFASSETAGLQDSESLADEQKFASFPPLLPNPWKFDEVSEFLQRYSTSMWHWHGSARIGLVTDDEMRVAGVDRLAIVDASVIGDLPKMNPQTAVMILGRYAGLIRAKQERHRAQY